MANKKLSKVFEKEAVSILLKEFKSVSLEIDLSKFFEKFMTNLERENFLKRIVVMILLNKNNKYRDIKELLGVSGDTISKVRDILEGRGYSINPNRKRKYSNRVSFRKVIKRRGIRYKGTSGLLDPFV